MTKVLVIEDEQSLQQDIVQVLGFEGMQAVGASDGLLGLEKAREFHPDLIICDIMMPKLKGHEVVAALRHDPDFPQIPIIFLTALADKQDMRKGMELGVDDYLTKPFTMVELLTAVRTQLTKRSNLDDAYKRKMDDLRDNLIIMLPHELRTPLTAILGFSEILVADSQTMDAEQVKEIGRIINKAGHRLHRLYENYLLYTQLELFKKDPSQFKALYRGLTYWPQMVVDQQAKDKAERTYRTADLRLEITEAGTIGVFENYLRRIVEELLDNAFKFSPQGSPVCVKAGIDNGKYALEISDQGHGMTHQQVMGIGAYMQFERKIHEQQGTGLGLAIVQQLADIYDGKMIIDSKLNEGTKVTVILPVL